MTTLRKGKEAQHQICPTLALDLLKKGNQRFVSNLKFKRNILVQTHEIQHPFAVILSCVDLEASAELIFNQNIGDVFSVRIAGNTINHKTLASMEFACKVGGSKLIVVLGHTQCGAIRNTCNHVEIGHVASLLVKIQPAFYYDFVDKIADINVKRAVRAVQTRSPILKSMIEKGEIGIIGGSYDTVSGKVTFFNDTLIIHKPSPKTRTRARKSSRIKLKQTLEELIV